MMKIRMSKALHPIAIGFGRALRINIATGMQRSNIQLRILVPLIVMLTVSFAILIAGLQDYRVTQQNLISQKVEQARLSLSFLKQEIEYHASQPASASNTQRLLMSKNIDGSIEALALVSSSGRVLASRFADRNLQTAVQLSHFTTAPKGQDTINLAADGQSIQAYIPLLSAYPSSKQALEEQVLLYASYKLNINQTAIWQQIFSNYLIIWLVVFFITMAVAFLLERLITRPLAKLAEFSQQISNNHAGQQHPDRYFGEIATLSQALNTMSRKVARTMEGLNAQQENLEVTLQSIGDAVITTDEKGIVTRMNPVAEQLTGWYAYEARGMPLKTIFPIVNASTRETIPNPVDKVLATGETVYLSNHTTLIARDGSEYQIADSAAPILNSNDETEGMVLVFNDITEEYQLRQAAREIQQQIESLSNDMQTMAGILELDGSVIFVNNTPLKLSGITFEDVAGKKLWDCPWFSKSPEARQIIQTCCKRAAAGEKVTQDIETHVFREKPFWAEFSVHPVLDEQGVVIQLLAEGHDISPRKRAEEELNASLQHIKLYREQTPLATIQWNMDFQIEDWNEAASKLFGYTRDEAIGHDASFIVPESAVPEVDHIWNSIIHQSGGEININQNITKEGRSILCEWHNKSIVDQTGTVVGIASLVLDITAEHEAKLALIKQEQEQREILNTLVQGIITLDETGQILNINPAVEQIFGYSKEELIGKDLSIIMPDFDAHKIDRYMTHYSKTGEIPTLDERREAIGLRKNETQFPLHATAAELPPAADGTRRFISACYDLTETKSQQAHLQRTQKMDALGKIVGGIAHDYNNMLGVILGYADLMAIKYHDIEGLNNYIEQVSQAGERGRDLTKRMLAFSKQESSHPEAIELHSLLAAQKELLGKSITALVKLEYDLCDSPWTIWLDPGELEDTLLNLAINAKHAMSDGGVLTLTTHRRHLSFSEARTLGLAEGDYMELSVTDNGCGISEELQSKVFDPFFTTKGSEGTGLGLSQAYGFMDRCGGTIHVESNQGLGTCFSLYFPRHEGAAAHQTKVKDYSEQARANGEKILIVDDEPALRELTREILTIAGYQVLIAGDGEAALAILSNEPVDLIISDIIMPKMTGYELAKIVSEKYPQTKIQLASGYSSDQTLDERQEILHSNILRKPFRLPQLLNTVAELLEAPVNTH